MPGLLCARYVLYSAPQPFTARRKHGQEQLADSVMSCSCVITPTKSMVTETPSQLEAFLQAEQ